MKKLILTIATLLILFGCSEADREKNLITIKKAYPKNTIYLLPNYNNKFIVKTDSGLILIRCNQISHKITDENQLIEVK